ncbi:hypothetical protein JCM9279_000167 [Rhodotorula babjevae]
MATRQRSAGVRRLLQEAQELEQDDCADYAAQPLEDDIFQWHFTLRGAEGSDYQGGVYHGKLVLPSDYPFRPPEVYMLTPSGRFEVNKKICLSISSFHPETWQPSWGIRTALLAIMAFFETEPKGAVGSLDAPPIERRRLALASTKHQCATCGFDAADEGSFAALAAPTAPRSAAAEQESQAPVSVTAPRPVEAAAPSSSESSTAPSPAALDSGDEHEVKVEVEPPEPPVLAESSRPTPIFPSAPSPPAPPRAPRSSSSSGRTPQGPRSPVNSFSGGSSAGPLVPPGAPRLSPAHLPPRAPTAAAAHPAHEHGAAPNPLLAHAPPALADAHGLPALPPGVSLAQLSPDGLAGGGPPSWVDRAIVACLLALVALVVRKVA